MDPFSAITDPVERVVAKAAVLHGQNIAYRSGVWVRILESRGGGATGGLAGLGERPLAQVDQAALNSALQEEQRLMQPEPEIAPMMAASAPSPEETAVGMVGSRFGGGYAPMRTGGWQSVSPTGRRNFVSRYERDELNRQTEGAQHYQEQAAMHAPLTGEPTGALSELDLGGEEEEGAGGGGGGGIGALAGRAWRGLRGRRGGAGGGAAGPLGVGALIGAGSQVLGQGGAVAQQLAARVGGFFSHVFDVAGSALGQTGAGAARIAEGMVNLTVSGFSTAAGAGVQLATGLLGVAALGLTAVGSMLGITLGGVIGGILAGALAAAGMAVGEAVGRLFGAIGQAAQDALNGVVSVVKDLAGVSRDLSQASLSMRGAGGMTGQSSMQALLMGTGLGMSSGQTAGMFGYGMQPMFAGARFGAFGQSYDPNDPAGSMGRAAQFVGQQPSYLQQPIANAMMGGGAGGDALLKMAQVPWEELSQTIALAQQLAGGRSADDMTRFEMRRGRVGMLGEALKIDILEALLPIMSQSLLSIKSFYEEHKSAIAAFIQNLPTLILHAAEGILRGLILLTIWAEKGYNVAAAGWEWFRGAWNSFAAATGLGLPTIGGGGAGGTVGTPGEASGVGTGAPGSSGAGRGRWGDPGIHPTAARWGQTAGAFARGIGGQDRAEGDPWAPYMLGRHPWAALGIGIAAMSPATPAIMGGIGSAAGAIGGAMGVGAAPVIGGAAIAGFGMYGMGSEYMRRREQGASPLQAGGAMARWMLAPGGAVAAPLVWGAQALGRRMSGTPSAAQQHANEEEQQQEMRGRGYLDPEEQWRRIRSGESIGRPAGSIRTQMEQARPPAAVQQLASWRADLERTLRELPNWIRQGQQEAARQREQQLKLEVSGTVMPSPLFALQMQYQVSLDMLRAVQVAVS